MKKSEHQGYWSKVFFEATKIIDKDRKTSGDDAVRLARNKIDGYMNGCEIKEGERHEKCQIV